MTTITRQEAAERIAGVLKAVGIKLDFFSYYSDVTIEFPDGAKFEDAEATIRINCDGIAHQRGSNAQ